MRLRISGTQGRATLERLQAPSVGSKSGVTWGGQSFGQSTTTGVLMGRSNVTSVTAVGGVYTVKLPAASAALLTLDG
jgi:Glycosyl hydrolase family 79 C-terminal beta domain